MGLFAGAEDPEEAEGAGAARDATVGREEGRGEAQWLRLGRCVYAGADQAAVLTAPRSSWGDGPSSGGAGDDDAGVLAFGGGRASRLDMYITGVSLPARAHRRVRQQSLQLESDDW